MIKLSQCYYCINLLIPSQNEIVTKIKCKAFPSGIPDELRRTDIVHNVPYPNDHEILFEQDPDEDLFDIEKVAKEINEELNKNILDSIVQDLETWVLEYSGIRVIDIYPNLKQKELDYVMSKYKGPMKRG